MSKPDREAMLERRHPELSIRRQCRLLSLNRSDSYTAARGRTPPPPFTLS